MPIWVWVGFGFSLLLRLAIAWLPAERSFALTVPDDGYYYFTIASNIAQGQGVTFDGLAPTNGFHPLWMALITPFWWIARKPDTLPVHLALTLGAVFSIPTAIGIWRLGDSLQLPGKWMGVGLLAFAWNPYNIAASVNGLETSVSALLFVWSLLACWQVRQSTFPTKNQWLLLATLWSLLLLARTDYAIVILPCALDLAWKQRHCLRNVWVAPVAALIWLPWLAWNWATFASFAQVSGNAYPYYLHAIWQAQGHSLQDWLLQEARMAYGILANMARLSGFDKGLLVLLVFIVGLTIWSFFKFGTQPGREANRKVQIQMFLWPTVGAITMLLVHGLVRWMYVPWYFVPISILLILWFCLALDFLDGHRLSVVSISLSVLVIGYQLVLGFNIWQSGGMWPDQAQAVDSMMPKLVEDCQRFEIVGISDSGFFGYYAPCRIVNLDGVVNNRVFEAIERGEFRNYLDRMGIERIYVNSIIRDVVAIREGNLSETGPFSAR
jgi:hypothetical protein